MAFSDANGKITIDEVAAANDIKVLKNSIEHLEMINKMLGEMIIRSENMSGDSATMINEISKSYSTTVNVFIEETEQTINYINKTISKYQEIDKATKKEINDTL